MGILGFGRKKVTVSRSTGNAAPSMSIGTIRVLGSGCPSCHALYENVQAAVRSGGFPYEVLYVTDMKEIVASGAMRMPALQVDGKIVSMGQVLKPAEVQKLLQTLPSKE